MDGIYELRDRSAWSVKLISKGSTKTIFYYFGRPEYGDAFRENYCPVNWPIVVNINVSGETENETHVWRKFLSKK